VAGQAILFGMGAIKNVGEGPTEAIVREREAEGEYRDIFDFCSRLDTRLVNRRLIESLNKAGAFAGTGWSRAQVDAVIDSALSEGQIAQRERASGQTSLFDMMGMEETVETMHQKPDLAEWPEQELLQREKEVLGLYVTGHPLAAHANTLERFNTVSVAHLGELREGQEVVIGGLVAHVKTYITGRGKMAFLTLETLEGSCEVTVFSDLFEQKADLLDPDAIRLFPAKVSYRNNVPGLIAQDILPIEEAEQHLTKALHIRIPAARLENGLAERLAEVLGERRGSCDVYLHCRTPGQEEIIVHATSACRVAPSIALRYVIETLLGEGSVYYSGGMGLPTHAAPKAAAPPEPRWKRKKAALN